MTPTLLSSPLVEESSPYPNNNAPYTPTPEQIAEECLAIQATWTEQERYGRHVLPPTQLYSAPYYERDVNLFPQVSVSIFRKKLYETDEAVGQVASVMNNLIN